MTIEDLAAAGADLEARDLIGMTPLDVLSRYGGKASVAAALLRAGAGAGADGGSAAGSERGAISAESAADVAGLRSGRHVPGLPRVPGDGGGAGRNLHDGVARGRGVGRRKATAPGDHQQPHRGRVYEVTFGEWDACALAGGCADYWPADGGWGRGRRPVINVSWNDAQGYLRWLSRETGEPYRLLSEAEWEYVARAGTQTARYWGESESGQCQYENGWDRTADADGESGLMASCTDGYEATAPVGSFQPNGFGLYDILGNVSEWTEDCDHGGSNDEEGYRGAPVDGSAWRMGNCSWRRVRGGSWGGYQFTLRSAIRMQEQAVDRSQFNGFRVARAMN